MPRPPSTVDVFNAIAEPRRRRILDLLSQRERAVGEIVRALRIPQPQASKHLRVLRAVHLVDVRPVGQQRLYHLHADGLKPVHDWVAGFERFWNQSFDRLDAYLRDLQEKDRQP